MLTRGKLIVLAILLLAVALALVNMAFQTRTSSRAVAYWGEEGARLILTAGKVELMPLREPRDDDASGGGVEYVDVGQGRLQIVHVRDISASPGSLHFRRALVTDELFDWNATPALPRWRYALRFREDESTFTILLDGSCLHCAALTAAEEVLTVRAIKGKSPLRDFVAEQLPQGIERILP